MAGKRKTDEDIPGTSQPPAGPTTKTTPDAPDSPDASLPAAARGSDDSERRTEVEPPARQQRPTTGGRERKHDLTAAADSAFRPVKNPASWTVGGSMGADLPRPSQWNYDMPPPQLFQSPQQHLMFLQGHTGLQVPQRAFSGFVFPPSKIAPASTSNQFVSPGQMRQQRGGSNLSIIPREDAEQRSASMREDSSRRALLQQGKCQNLDQEQATMSALQGNLRLGQPGAAAQVTMSARQEKLRLSHPGVTAQAQEQATMSAREEKLRLGRHPAAALTPVLVDQSVATLRGLELPRLIVPCLCCRARPALAVLNPIQHLCICEECFSDPSKVCPVCRPG